MGANKRGSGHVKISTALEKTDEHQLFVPAFQRECVWKREDGKQLIDSLIKHGNNANVGMPSDRRQRMFGQT